MTCYSVPDYVYFLFQSKVKVGKNQSRRNAFMICVLHRSINAAAIDYKQRMCAGHPNVSYEKSINLLHIDW